MARFGVYYCAYCSSRNETQVETGGGRGFEYVEDCQTCCRPNVLSPTQEREGRLVVIDARQEND